MVSIVFHEEEDVRSVRSGRSGRSQTSTVASTVATTVSLASRIAALTVDFNDKLQDVTYEDSILEENESDVYSSDDDRAEPAGVPSDAGATGIRRVTREQDTGSPGPRLPPFQVCSRLFIHKGNHPIQLKKLTIAQVEELKLHGYVIVDNFIPKDNAVQIKAMSTAMYRRDLMQDGAKADMPDTIYPDRVTRGDSVLWLTMGKPPADTTAFSAALVAFQELFEDLHEFVRLKKSTGEFQVAFHPASSSGISRHRDALPDNGKDTQRRVTCMTCCNSDWDKEQGGTIRIWPPRRGPLGHPPSSRRSLTGSDGGTSYSELSDCCSLRSHFYAPSTTSSMMPEVAPPEPDVRSLDGVSLAESADPERLGLEWLESEGGDMVLDVAPLPGRLLIFLSGAVDHAQQPTNSDLVALTAWYQ